ncbi:hypothetical protein [Nonomuraea sp. B5E05]|uniref:hypothetical protein n=1 Tax=Nonomuraea sp. B5E05 TaxID=3153569 RepID=UPI003260806B
MQNESDLVLPLDTYDLTSEQRSTVQTARYLLIERCVAGFGLKFKPHNTKPIAYPKNASYLGWLGAKKVAENGYSGPPGQWEEAAAAVSGIRGYVIPRKQDAVHVGTVKTYKGRAVPSEGCDGWAQRKLNGNAPGPDGKVPAKPHIYKNLYVLMDDAAIAAYNHPQVQAAGSAWSECMRASGFTYPDPPAAESDKRWAGRGGQDSAWQPPGKDEIAVAVADEACRLKVDYSGARKRAYASAQEKIIAANRPTIDRLSNLLKVRYANAAKILS